MLLFLQPRRFLYPYPITTMLPSSMKDSADEVGIEFEREDLMPPKPVRKKWVDPESPEKVRDFIALLQSLGTKPLTSTEETKNAFSRGGVMAVGKKQQWKRHLRRNLNNQRNNSSMGVIDEVLNGLNRTSPSTDESL